MTVPTPQPDDTDTQGASEGRREPAQPKDSKSITNVSLWRSL
jgi:hypothetical protein